MQEKSTEHRIVRPIDVPVVTLAELLTSNLPPGQEIDLLTVDVEGLDLEVLQSNDWGQFRPRFIVAEELAIRALDRIGESPIVQFLSGQGYRPVANTLISIFFERVDR